MDSAVPSESKSGRRIPVVGEAVDVKGAAVMALVKPGLFGKAKAKQKT